MSELLSVVLVEQLREPGGPSQYMYWLTDSGDPTDNIDFEDTKHTRWAVRFSFPQEGEIWVVTNPDGTAILDPLAGRYPFTERLAETQVAYQEMISGSEVHEPLREIERLLARSVLMDEVYLEYDEATALGTAGEYTRVGRGGD